MTWLAQFSLSKNAMSTPAASALNPLHLFSAFQASFRPGFRRSSRFFAVPNLLHTADTSDGVKCSRMSLGSGLLRSWSSSFFIYLLISSQPRSAQISSDHTTTTQISVTRYALVFLSALTLMVSTAQISSYQPRSASLETYMGFGGTEQSSKYKRYIECEYKKLIMHVLMIASPLRGHDEKSNMPFAMSRRE